LGAKEILEIEFLSFQQTCVMSAPFPSVKSLPTARNHQCGTLFLWGIPCSVLISCSWINRKQFHTQWH